MDLEVHIRGFVEQARKLPAGSIMRCHEYARALGNALAHTHNVECWDGTVTYRLGFLKKKTYRPWPPIISTDPIMQILAQTNALGENIAAQSYEPADDWTLPLQHTWLSIDNTMVDIHPGMLILPSGYLCGFYYWLAPDNELPGNVSFLKAYRGQLRAPLTATGISINIDACDSVAAQLLMQTGRCL